MFRVPDSDDDSNPPSTPNRNRNRNRKSSAGPSTTPAGPPPGLSQFGPSSTPAGAPPTGGLFGGARPKFEPKAYNFTNSLFGSSPPKDDVLQGNGLGHMRTTSRGPSDPYRGRTANPAFNRFPTGSTGTRGLGQEHDGGMDEDAEGDEDETMDGGVEIGQPSPQRRAGMRNSFSQSLASMSSMGDYNVSDALDGNPAKLQQTDLLGLAKSLTHGKRAAMNESDDLILDTERILEKVHVDLDENAPEAKDEALRNAAQELLAVWRTCTLPNVSNATKLSELLLGIHHPGRMVPEQRNLSTSRALIQPGSKPFQDIPKVLLDWLNTHQSVDDEIQEVLNERGGYSRQSAFWDAVQMTALRGQLAKTMELLQGANFAVAYTAEEDEDTPGYRGHKLEHATVAARSAFNLLELCPGLLGDWDVKGNDWNIFRQRIRQAKHELEEYAEGDSQSRFTMSQSLGGSHFGLSQSRSNFGLSTHSRKVECKVPWTVYEQLNILYNIMSGDEQEIITWSQTWTEATLCLTIWWNGKHHQVLRESLAASRPPFVNPPHSLFSNTEQYQRRLAASLVAVIEGGDEELALPATNPFEVGLACILEGNVEAALHILRSQTLVLASAVAEVGSAGEWFKRNSVFGELDQSDLLLLSYNQPNGSGLTKDDLLVSYAEQLSTKDHLSSQTCSSSRAGWELAIQVLGRLDDTVIANERIQRILDELPLTSAEQVDKVTQLCHNMGLSDQALGIALKFADHLNASSQNYGDAILYYARAHEAPKVQEVLRALVAHCLVKSVAYPPLSELDGSLKKLVTSPKKTLTELAALDPEAAELLSSSLSGYATIRKFYDLRDEEVLLEAGEKPAHRPLARKRTAASALMGIISSAASSIRGGLYDPEVESVVQVDVLLPLLGEALVFVNQPKRTLTLRNLYDLLAAVEDLSTAPSMIQTQCEEALRTTLLAAHEHNPRSMQKSTSNLTTASSQYSLIGSMDLGSVEGVSTESSTVLIKGGGVDEVKRGWDWRKGFPRGAKGEDVIRVLRLGIAQELARAFAEGEIAP